MGLVLPHAASVPSAANAAVTTLLDAVSVRYLRVRVTGSHDRVQPPRNVQIATLELHAPAPVPTP